MILAEFNGYFKEAKGFSAMEMPLSLRKYVKKFSKLVESPFSTIPIAFVLSALLLPCSSGPYITALAMISSNVNKLFVLTYYNLLFISPMLLITFLVAKGISPKTIIKWKEKHTKHLHLIAGILLLIILVYYNYNHLAYTSTTHTKGSIYLVYSLTCPHCTHLKESLPSGINITYISINSEKVKEISDKLPKWKGGVPLMVCFRNQSPLVMLGYPAKSQDKEGYFYGEKEEKAICEEYNGTKILENGKYKYCILPSGYMMGNKYALNEIINAYKKGECI